MKKALVEKKISLFKETFPDYFISKKSDSLYAKVDVETVKKKIVLDCHSITKGTLDKFGTTNEWEHSIANVFLLTKTGRLMFKTKHPTFKDRHHKQNFHNVTHKTVRWFLDNEYAQFNNSSLTKEQKKNLCEIFFIGKKAEWLKDYPFLWSFRYFRSFKSLNEAKNHLGYTFINNETFLKCLEFNYKGFEILLTACKSKEEMVNVVSLVLNENFNTATFTDYLSLCAENNSTPYIPKGMNALTKLHDKESMEMAKGRVRAYPNKPIYYSSPIFEGWKRDGLKFKVVDTERSLFIRGQLQKHCIGGQTYRRRLWNNENLFVVFEWEGKEYDAQIHIGAGIRAVDGVSNKKPYIVPSLPLRTHSTVNRIYVAQIKGKRNSIPDPTLRALIEKSLTNEAWIDVFKMQQSINCDYDIADRGGDYGEYDPLAEKQTSPWREALGLIEF